MTRVYDAFDPFKAEYSSVSAPATARTSCYLSDDHLGSVRLVTKADGTVLARHDYLPFGEEIASNQAGRNSPFGASDSLRQRFTGQERDVESGLDYFGARYYGSALGRFTSPDEPLADQDEADPQSWNLYGYVRNNPLTNVDPTGRACSFAKDEEGRTIINDLDGKGCAELHDNTVSAFGGNEGLAALAAVGAQLNDPHQIAQFVSDAGQAAGSVVAPLPTALAQCATGTNCNKTNLVLAMVPQLPGMGNIGQFVTGQVVRRIIQTPEGPLVLEATVEVIGDTVKLGKLSLAHADGLQVVTNPGSGAIKALFDGLKGELVEAGFAKVQVIALRTTGANSPRLINRTINLK